MTQTPMYLVFQEVTALVAISSFPQRMPVNR